MAQKKYTDGSGVGEIWLNIKNYIASQLLGYSQTGHTHSASDITSGLATVATSGSYNDLSNKPTIPKVNNATLTIQKNGTTVKTFTANASSNVTANITVPTKVSQLTNDSGFITGIAWGSVTDKPSTFTPSSHTHTKSQITDLDLNNYLPLRGGTLNGSIAFSGTCYTTVGTGKELSSERYVVTTTHGSNLGGSLYLYGGDHENPWGEKGNFRLVAQSKEKGSKYLLGTPSGSLTWNGKELATQEYVNTNYSQTGHTHSISDITDIETWNYDSSSNAILVRGGSDVWSYDSQSNSIIVS